MIVIDIALLAIGIVLLLTILIQHRGTGLGAAFGGESAVFRTRRGLEKSLHIATIVLSVLFLAIAFAKTLL